MDGIYKSDPFYKQTVWSHYIDSCLNFLYIPAWLTFEAEFVSRVEECDDDNENEEDDEQRDDHGDDWEHGEWV